MALDICGLSETHLVSCGPSGRVSIPLIVDYNGIMEKLDCGLHLAKSTGMLGPTRELYVRNHRKGIAGLSFKGTVLLSAGNAHVTFMRRRGAGCGVTAGLHAVNDGDVLDSFWTGDNRNG